MAFTDVAAKGSKKKAFVANDLFYLARKAVSQPASRQTEHLTRERERATNRLYKNTGRSNSGSQRNNLTDLLCHCDVNARFFHKKVTARAYERHSQFRQQVGRQLSDHKEKPTQFNVGVERSRGQLFADLAMSAKAGRKEQTNTKTKQETPQTRNTHTQNTLVTHHKHTRNTQPTKQPSNQASGPKTAPSCCHAVLLVHPDVQLSHPSALAFAEDGWSLPASPVLWAEISLLEDVCQRKPSVRKALTEKIIRATRWSSPRRLLYGSTSSGFSMDDPRGLKLAMPSRFKCP